MDTNSIDANEDPVDRVLSYEEEIVPSAGFTAAVMGAVRNEAATPSPIPFPWKRAWPVLLLAALTIVAVPIVALTEVVRLASAPASASPVDMSFLWPQFPAWMSNPTVGWTIGSLLLAWVAVKFSMRLASR